MLFHIVTNPMMLFSGSYPGVYDNVMDNDTPGTQYIANVNEPSYQWSDYSSTMGTQPDDYHVTGAIFEPAGTSAGSGMSFSNDAFLGM
mmetsp:Transcript_17626/g.44359  ORF Transcript_17626/g.44359 Transcript_17626/m.44359 type:complete len:88 (+) Transcript_17626:29-292(+)